MTVSGIVKCCKHAPKAVEAVLHPSSFPLCMQLPVFGVSHVHRSAAFRAPQPNLMGDKAAVRLRRGCANSTPQTNSVFFLFWNSATIRLPKKNLFYTLAKMIFSPATPGLRAFHNKRTFHHTLHRLCECQDVTTSSLCWSFQLFAGTFKQNLKAVRKDTYVIQ